MGRTCSSRAGCAEVDEARRRRHGLRVPEVHAGAVPARTNLWDGYPEETNAPYGIAKKSLLVGAQAYREQYGLDSIFLLPANLYGPRDNFHPTNAHVIPDLIRKMLESPERSRAVGRRLADARVPLRRRLRRGARARGRALRRRRAGQPRRRRRRSRSASSPSSSPSVDGLHRPDRVGHVEAERTAAPSASTRRARASCSASKHERLCAKGSNARSPGTASRRPRMPPRSPLLRQPWNVLLPLALLQWLLLLVLTHRIVHNGWLFAQDGSGDRRSTRQRGRSRTGTFRPRFVGYGWPLLTTPVAGVDRRRASSTALPGRRAPPDARAAAASRWSPSTASRAGSAAGCSATSLAQSGSFCRTLVAPAVRAGYHPTYVQQLLPQGLGLTGLGGFPVDGLRARRRVLRRRAASTPADPVHAALGGLFAGFAIALDPANVLFLAAPAVGYALARRVVGGTLASALRCCRRWRP